MKKSLDEVLLNTVVETRGRATLFERRFSKAFTMKRNKQKKKKTPTGSETHP